MVKKITTGRKSSSKNKAKTKLKPAKTYDLSTGSNEDPPWDEDETSSAEDLITKAEAQVKKSKRISKSKTKTTEDLLEEIDANEEADELEHAKFVKGMRRISKRVGAKSTVYNSPATQEYVTRQALASIVRLLPRAERSYRQYTNDRGAYAYNTLINQVRELMADLGSMASTDTLADRVIEEAVQPAFLQLVDYMLREVSNIRTKLNTSNDADTVRRGVNEQLNNMLINLGEYGQETLEKAKENARKSIRK